MTEPNQNLEQLAKDAREQMEKAIAAFRHELSRVRTGRASLALLEPRFGTSR